MSHIAPFCPSCGAYFPAGATCPACRQGRPLLETPPAPDRPLWRVQLSGALALRPALAHVDGRALLLLPWGSREMGTGGVIALDAADGSRAWEAPLGMPVEGGVAVAEAAGLALVGLSRRDQSSSEGAITALDLRTGQERWSSRVQAAAAVEAAPVTDGIRAYVAADDSQLYCVEAGSGRVVWRKPVLDKPVRIPASPALLIEREIAQIIVVATYGVTPWQADGKVVACDATGRRLWLADPKGQVRGAPVIAHGRVYVAAYRGSPATGVLSTFDLRTGRPAWREPFVIQAPARSNGSGAFVAAPLVVGNKLYIGSLDHRLYEVDVTTGQGRMLVEVAHGIASTPALCQGLVVFGSNADRNHADDDQIHLLDPASGERPWSYNLGSDVMAGILSWGDVLFAASDNGQVVALPWHGGRYEWAAARLEAAQQWSRAGDCRALAAHFHGKPDERAALYRQAAADFDEGGEYERTAQMWTGLGARWRREAAEAWQRAGLALCDREPERAGSCFQRAADLYYGLYTAEPFGAGSADLAKAHNDCTRSLADCAGLPYLTARLDNADSLEQWVQRNVTLRLVNQGRRPVQQEIRLTLGGGFAESVEARVMGDLAPKATWRVSLLATATRPESLLEGEIEYGSGDARYPLLRTLLVQPIHAQERPRPVNVTVGDVARFELKLASAATTEGATIQLVTQDVGAIFNRGGRIESVEVRGDVGALVGVDPVTRQQVADLSEAMHWLGGRVQQLEAAPRGPEPATSEDIAALRADLAGHQAGIQGVLARLTSEQQAALTGLVDQVRQVEDQLAALGRAQAQASRSAIPSAPPSPPVDPLTARWARRPDCVAQRIEVNDLRGYLARGLVIEPGVLAIFLEDGRAKLGQVGPDQYWLDTLLDRMPGMRGIRRTTALVFESGEMALAFALPDLPTADGRRVAAQAELCFRLADGMAFFVNYMQGSPEVLRAELRDHLLPEVRDAAREWLASRRAPELSGSLAQKDALAAAVDEHLRETLDALGLRFERVRALAFA